MEFFGEINWKHDLAAVVMGFVLSFVFTFLVMLSIKTGGTGFWSTFIYLGFIVAYLLSRAPSISKMLSWTLIILGLTLLPLHFVLSEYDVNQQIRNQEYAQEAELLVKTSNINLTAEQAEFINVIRDRPKESLFGLGLEKESWIGFLGGIVLILAGYGLQRNNAVRSKKRKK